jgi:conjugative transfer region lipoprotein (TIGR03751 family)
VHWIKQGLKLAAMGVVLGGCASQDTMLPSSDRKMADIYREAMSEQSGVPLDTGSEALCDDLDLDESIEACQETIEAHAAARYSIIDSYSGPQSLDYIPYTRELRTELNNLFPRLPNPDLVIYVYPHLATRTRAPIPGYSTVIPLYDRVEYRLPGEDLAETPLPNKPVAAVDEASQ